MDKLIETTLEKDGTLTLTDLPFHAGDAVEVTIRSKPGAAEPVTRRRRRGTPVSYVSPFEPVAAGDWESTR